jgi:hypothetical protein
MTGHELHSVANELAPQLFSSYDWSDIWDRPIENGSSYEWTVIAALINQAEANGYKLFFPYDSKPYLRQLFTLRNEVPFQYAAQAGHSLENQEVPLSEKFEASLLPKVTLQKDGKSYSIFTEGFPYHKLMSSKSYTERPDIVIVEGQTVVDSPSIVSEGTRINFAFNQGSIGTITGQLRIITSAVIPLTKREPASGCEPNVLGVIETSVNKTYLKASTQLARYNELFSNSQSAPKLYLVSGNNLKSSDLDSYFTDFSSNDLSGEFRNTAHNILLSMRLI